MINNYQKGKMILDKLKRDSQRPTLLLHVCCGACSTYPLELLNEYFDITIYFTNSNIYPYEEYNKRLDTLKYYVDYFNNQHSSNIKIIESKYNNEDYMKLLSIRKDDNEKGPRCKLCYTLRMKETFLYAKENNFDYCTTVMSMSRQKDELAINQIGSVLEKLYPEVKFLPHNFKKKGGQERRDEIVDSLIIYDQKYCGCIYSINKK